MFLYTEMFSMCSKSENYEYLCDRTHKALYGM